MQDNYIAAKIQLAGIDAEQRLLVSLKQTGILDICYSYKTRLKSEEKLIEKKEKKILEKDKNYKLIDITDVIGLRFITLFRIEMATVFDKIIDIIINKNDLKPYYFKDGIIKEIIVYHTSPNDKIPDMIKEITKEKGIPVTVDTHIVDREYSSIHIVTYLDIEVKEASTHEEKYFLPVEIQIRTAFEDAWGEIDHKYKYKLDKCPVSYEKNNKLRTDSIKRHLIVLKKFADACAEYADAVFADANYKDTEDVDQQEVISVPTDKETLERFSELGVTVEIIKSYQEAREKRISSEQEEKERKDSGIKGFLKAAYLFEQIALLVEKEKLCHENTKEYLLFYYCKMNEAISLLSTNQSENVQNALIIYKELSGIYHEFPLLKMRLGQAYGKVNYLELAIENLYETYLFINKFEQEGLKFSDKLPSVDYDHIKTHLPKIYGYNLWKKCEKIRSDPEKIDEASHLLHNAYYVTSEIITYKKDKNVEIDIYNNLLYYSLDLWKMKQNYPLKRFDDKIFDNIENFIKKIEKKKSLKEITDLDLLDTMLCAYEYTKNQEKMRLVLDKIILMVNEPTTAATYDKDFVPDILENALRIKDVYFNSEGKCS